MKRTSMGMRLTCLIMIICVVVAGCSQPGQNADPTPTPEPVEDVIVCKVGDQTIMRSEYIWEFWPYHEMLSTQYEYDFTNESNLKTLQNMVFDIMLNRELVMRYAQQEGITLTEEEEAEAQKLADEEYENKLLSYIDPSMTDITQEDKDNALLVMTDVMAQDGTTPEAYKAFLIKRARGLLLEEKVRKSIMDPITMDEEKAQTYFEVDLQTQKTKYTTTPSEYEAAQNEYDRNGGLAPLYVPEGYVRVKHILVKDEETAKEVLDKLAQPDADFDALVEEYGTDPGMKVDPNKSLGYLLCAESSYLEEFKTAALALENVGDYTHEAVKTSAGYHIIQLVQKVEAREATYEDVKEVYPTYALNKLQTDAYQTKLEEWQSAEDVISYIGRVRDVGKKTASATE